MTLEKMDGKHLLSKGAQEASRVTILICGKVDSKPKLVRRGEKDILF